MAVEKAVVSLKWFRIRPMVELFFLEQFYFQVFIYFVLTHWQCRVDYGSKTAQNMLSAYFEGENRSGDLGGD